MEHLRGTSRASFLALSGPLTEPKCSPPISRLALRAGHDLLRRHHRKNGGRGPPRRAARPNAVPTRRSELLSSPSQNGDTTDPMRRARPSQGLTRSRTRIPREGFAEFDLGPPHFCISPSWPRTSSRWDITSSGETRFSRLATCPPFFPRDQRPHWMPCLRQIRRWRVRGRTGSR